MLPEAPEPGDFNEEAVVLPEGVAVSDALCNALRDLADENGLITVEGLCGSAGLDEGVIAALEQRIGPGPWPLATLEALLGTIFGPNGISEDHPVDDGISAAKLAGDVSGISDSWCGAMKAPSCHWRTPELQQLEDAIDEALRTEDTTATQVLDEPESEHPLEAEALEAGIGRLQEAVGERIVAPLVKRSSGTEEAVARQMLATFVEDVLAVLRKTWQLARIRGQQVHHLSGSLTSARAKVEKQQHETEGHGVKAQEMVESATSRLNASKRALKEKDWELSDARRRIEQLERDQKLQEQKLRLLEAASQRETAARGDAERRLAEAKSEKEAEANNAVAQEGTLRRRLAAAELALSEMKEELSLAEQRMEEARLCADQHAVKLTADLSESQLLVEELRRQLQETGHGEPSSTGERRHRRRSEGDSGSRGAVRDRQHRLSLPSQPALEVVREEALLGQEPAEAQQQHRHRRSSKQSQSARGDAGGVPPVPTLRGLLPRPTGAEQAPSTLGSVSRPRGLNSLPMDLKGLGKLLTGGGVTPRR